MLETADVRFLLLSGEVIHIYHIRYTSEMVIHMVDSQKYNIKVLAISYRLYYIYPWRWGFGMCYNHIRAVIRPHQPLSSVGRQAYVTRCHKCP